MEEQLEVAAFLEADRQTSIQQDAISLLEENQQTVIEEEAATLEEISKSEDEAN